jgi:hypothetical protein
MKEMRPLTTDERASFAILALYMGLFCVCSFIFWDLLWLKVLGVTAATAGLFLFVAAFFNTEARGHGQANESLHPVRSYLISFFIALLVLFLLRFLGGLIGSLILSVTVLYVGAALALIIFRKAMVQVITTLLAVFFIIVIANNWNDVLSRQMTFKDALRQSGMAVFQIGPIQDVTNMLIAGNYMGYLNRIDYRDPQINIVATRAVAEAQDDDLRKTEAILKMVSNDIHYVSDPGDGLEFAKDPVITLISGGGDCEDQTLLLCSLLETVGVKTYIVFTDEHVFALVPFEKDYPELLAAPHVFVGGTPCYALDPSDRDAKIGQSSATPKDISRVFDVRRKALVRYSIFADD